jgi:hypothetical protein
MPYTNVDLIAEEMIGWGKMARTMPRSYDAASVTYRVNTNEGADLGRMLPGRGFMSKVPLRSLGIHRQPPHVYDPSRFMRIRDAVQRYAFRHGIFDTERGAITTYDGIIAARGAGNAQDIAFVKTTITTTANIWYTLWHAGGQPPAGTYLATTAPTDANLDRTNAAALSTFLTNPTSPARKYLLSFGFAAGQQINMLILVDVINHGGAYRLSVTSAETVTTPTITGQRQYSTGTGVGNLVTLICATAGTPGTASTSILQYVNQAGSNTNAPTLNVTNSAILADVIWPACVAVTTTASFFVPLASGDTGVQAVKQHTASVAGTGTLAHQVFFPLSFMPGISAGAYVERDSTIQIDGITELVQASNVLGHLTCYVLPNTTSTGVTTGFMRTAAG